MALVLKNRVLETCTSPGTGTVTLLGATTGYQTFSATVGNGNTCYYTIADQGSANWEVGIGTYATTGNTLTRNTVLSSSNGGGLTNFSTGTQNVFVDYPAEKAVYLDASGNAIPLGSASATQLDITAQGDLRLQDTTGGEYVAIQAPATLASSYTLTMPADDGTAGQALVTDGSGVLSWSTAASGDVYGPASATDNAVARFDSTTGKIIQNSAVTIADDGATVIAANSSSDGLRITQVGAGNALLVEDSANPDSSPFVINTNGVVIQDKTTARTNYFAGTSTAQFQGSTFAAVDRGGAFDAGPAFILSKNRGATGDNTIVVANDTLGQISFQGADGTNLIPGAAISGQVDGTPGLNDMPGRLVFSTTPDGSATLSERMRIDSAGRVGIGGTPTTGEMLALRNTAETTATVFGFRNVSSINQATTTTAYGISDQTQILAPAALTNLFRFRAASGGFTGTATNQYGYAADAGLTGATNNYGFHSNIASGTGRWNFYAAGTASNYFAGNVGIGIDAPTNKLMMYENAATNVFTSSGNSLATWLAGVSSTGNYTIYSNNAYAVTFSTSGVERGRVSSSGVWSFGALPGSESLRVTPVASAVNYVEALGALTAQPPTLRASGSDTNIPLWVSSKGTSGLNFYTNTFSTLQFSVVNTASAVNYLQVTGNAAGSYSSVSAQGSDTNTGIGYISKGSGYHFFATNGGTATQFLINHTASAVNYLQVTGAATGGSPVFSAQGSDANISVQYFAKGTGGHYFYNSAGYAQFVVAQTATAVNYLQVTGNATTGAPFLSAQGSDTNINVLLLSKGTGGHVFTTGSVANTQFVVSHTASAVNYFQVTGGDGSTTSPRFSAQGSSTDVTMQFLSKGTGELQFFTNSGTRQFNIAHTASAVNYLQATGSATGNNLSLSAAGTDTNIGIDFSSKGFGSLRFFTGGNRQFNIADTASAVNYLQVTGSTTGNRFNLSAQGSDTNIGMNFSAKGAENFVFSTSAGTAPQFLIAHTASTVNYLQVTGAATGAAATLSAGGSDTNIDIKLTPKGTGVLAFGTYTAGILAQAGYITIKDAAGNTRNLLVG